MPYKNRNRRKKKQMNIFRNIVDSARAILILLILTPFMIQAIFDKDVNKNA